MRATVNFEVNVERVPQSMRVLAQAELDQIGDAVLILEHLEEGPAMIRQLEEVVDELMASADQLSQYRQMLVSFERSRLADTSQHLEQIAAEPEELVSASMEVAATDKEDSNVVRNFEDLRSILSRAGQFEGFVVRLNAASERREEIAAEAAAVEPETDNG